MHLILRALPALLASWVLASANAASPGRTLSTSRQFVVYGPDAKLRGAVCDLAERTKKTALDLLQRRDEWKTPIVVDAQYAAANLPELPPAQLDLGQTGFGLKLQLSFRLGSEVDASAIQREILRAIYLEMIYRGLPETPAGAPVAQPPEWLLEGTLALAEARDSSGLAKTLASVIASGKIITLEEFLAQKPSLLESPSRKIYRAYAAALLSLLIEAPTGRAGLMHFLTGIPQAENDPLLGLRRHFPLLGEEAGDLQEKWTAQISRFAGRERSHLLSVEETEKQLAQLLRLELRDPAQAMNIFALEEFPRYLREPNASAELQALAQRLLLFSAKANPLLRPVVAEYQQIATLLVRRNTKRLTSRLAELRATREHIIRRMSAIGDYMNWFEATQTRSTSGQFREYLKAAELAQEPEPRRRDRISIYLDALEAQFEN